MKNIKKNFERTDTNRFRELTIRFRFKGRQELEGPKQLRKDRGTVAHNQP
jgi:hypothetical protein